MVSEGGAINWLGVWSLRLGSSLIQRQGDFSENKI